LYYQVVAGRRKPIGLLTQELKQDSSFLDIY
jgi:hypothetical protein